MLWASTYIHIIDTGASLVLYYSQILAQKGGDKGGR